MQPILPLPNTTGRFYKISGHWSKDFIGILMYRGEDLALLMDEEGHEREICYLENVEFRILP